MQDSVMMAHLKFDVAQLERLNDIGRFETLRPDVMWQALGDPQPHVIVDIGAGTGLFARKFAEMAPDAIVYAVDTEQVMVDWMAEHVSGELRDRIRPTLGGETTVPLPDGSADLVLMINLHHELAEPLASYREALRLLHDGGKLLVVDWRPGDTEKGPPQNVRATAEQIAQTLMEAGFDEVVIHPGLPMHSVVTAGKQVR
jgi:SAM-dependent methyltransferase